MDVRKVGAFISELRKSSNYTQVDLANLLNISHQAVSKWERGESLPDIGLLPELAKLLNVTIEELLNGESIVKEVPQSCLSSTLVADRSSSSPNNSGSPMFTMNHILSLAAFTSKDTLEAMVNKVEGDIDWNSIIGIAPFIGRRSLEQLTFRIINHKSIDLQQVPGLAPFLSQKVLERLMNNVDPSTIDWKATVPLAPFLGKEALLQLVQQVPHNPNLTSVVNLAPFLNRNDLAALIERMETSRILPDHLTALAPFVASDVLQKLIDDCVGKN